MKIGIDFDNTIVNYTGVFYKAALDKELVTEDCGKTKEEVKAFLHDREKFDEWTKLQGFVYGKCMYMASLFSGVEDFLSRLTISGVPFCIISHKTRKPFLGPDYDLHKAAADWIRGSAIGGYFKLDNNLFFEEKIEDKLNRISLENATHFIDDLEQVVNHPQMPSSVKTFLFNDNWSEIQDQILK